MPSLAVLIDAPESVAKTRLRIQHILEEVGLKLREFTDPSRALAEVKVREPSDIRPALWLLGAGLTGPLSVARQLHQTAPQCHIVFLVDGHDALLEAGLRSPVAMIGTHRTVADLSGATLASTLREAAYSAKQTSQFRTTVNRINVELASQTSDTWSDLRRPAVSDRFLANILENAQDAIIAADNEGMVITWNRAAESLFGITPDNAIGHDLTTICEGEWSDQLPSLIAQLRRLPHASRSRELLCNLRDGRNLHLELVLSAVHDHAGTPLGISAIVRDITERRRAERALRESEERLRAILDNSPAVIYMLDIDGRYTFVNRQWESVSGVPRDSAIGKTLRDLWPDATAEAFSRSNKVVIKEGKSVEQEELIEQADGMHTYLSLKFPLFSSKNTPYAICGISTDITTRKQAQDQFRLAVEAAPNAMVMVDRDGGIVLVNRQAEVLFGYTRTELMGMAVEDLIPDRFRAGHPALREGYFTSPEARPVGAGRDLYALRKDGSEFPVEIGLTPVRTDQGLFVLSAIVDNSVRKGLEDTLRRSNQDLEARVVQRTRELTVANENLERSNIELRRFAYVASHDLQSPLRSISGFLQLLQHDYAGQLDGQAHDWINRVVESTNRMKTLIQDLLDYSRVDAQSRPFASVDLRGVFDDVLEALGPSVRDAGAEIVCDDLPEVYGDRSQLAQLLQNLVENAIKYNESKPPRVRLSARPDEDRWLVSVRDNGIGIDAAHLEPIFEIFYRLHTQDKYPGTGIGLAVCRRIVHRHGGRMWVVSEPGKGSEFFFMLPQRTEA